MSEDELIDGLLRKDELSFKYLINSQKDRVYNTSLGLLQNFAEAEDLTQEVFIEVFESIHSFKRQSKLSTWIYRITVTKSLEHLRMRKRQKRYGFMIRLFQNGPAGVAETDVPDFVHPGVQLENRERAAILFKCIDCLPENQRIAFTLHKIEELSHAEISGIMEVTVSSVESLIHRAKQNLQKELKKII